MTKSGRISWSYPLRWWVPTRHNRYMDTNTTADRFVRSMLPGSYISTDGRLNASLKSAGYCGTCGCKCVRHYHITYVHSTATIGTACTLKQAADRYLGWNR